jgi:hypothetical protein
MFALSDHFAVILLLLINLRAQLLYLGLKVIFEF